MPYRAQFAYSTPPGFRDEYAEYFFDETSVPVLDVNLNPGQILANISLLQPNSQTGTFLAEFHLRAIQIGEFTAFDNTTPIGIRFRDNLGNYLSNDFESCAFFEGLNVDALTHGSWAENLEPELVFPEGSVFMIDICNLSAAHVDSVNPFPITLKGVHRFQAGQ